MKKAEKKVAPAKPVKKAVKKAPAVEEKPSLAQKLKAKKTPAVSLDKPGVDHGAGREVVYPAKVIALHEIGSELGPLTHDQAKALLGWEEEGNDKFETEFDLTDNNGKKVRLNNNLANRPLDRSQYRSVESDILNRRWKLNGETMIVGRTGLTLSCQHRLVALILAWQEWIKNKEDNAWPEWPGAPTMEAIIVYGVSEHSSVVDTIDTGKSRSLADVIFRSEFFEAMGRGDREKVARICEYAIKFLGDRTAAWADAFSSRRTHSENIDFLHRHPRLLKCVKFIFDSEEEKSISSKISPGYAAGLMFLMGSCGSDGESYLKAGAGAKDSLLTWDDYKRAEDFWELIGSKDLKMFPIQQALAMLIEEDEDGVATPHERVAIIVKAWKSFHSETSIQPDDLKLEYTTDGDGVKHLAECPSLSAIDFGNAKKREADQEPITP